MKIKILGLSAILIAVPVVAVAQALSAPMQARAVILPLQSQADTSDALATEATHAIQAELIRDGITVTAINPSSPGARGWIRGLSRPVMKLEMLAALQHSELKMRRRVKMM